MTPVQYVLRSIFGAWRLAMFDKSAMTWFDLGVSGFWRSFAVALLVAPIYFLTILVPIENPQTEQPIEVGFAVNLAIYVLTWIVFPVVMIFIARILGLSRCYVPFIVAHNWSQIIIVLAQLPINLVRISGVFDQQAAVLAGMVVFFAILAYNWFIARTALRATAGVAAGVVVIDLLIEILVIVLLQAAAAGPA